MSCTPFEGGVVTPAATGASPSGSASAAAGLPYSQSWTPSPVELPFERYFAAADAAFEALDTSGGVDSRERENRIEEFKASCMKERGFTYYPVPAAEPAPDAGLGDVGHDALWSIPFLPDTLEEVERVGYGITRPLEGSATPEASAAEQQNQAYREGLTSSAQREYDLALYGYYDQASYADQGTVADACGSLAAEAFPGYSAPSGDSFERWYALTEPLDGIAEAFTITAWNDRAGVAHEDIGPYAAEADPRMADLQAEYSKCVRALAVGWEPTVDNPQGPFTTAMLTGPDGSQWDGWPEDGTSVDASSVPEGYAGLIGSQIEIDIAVVDFKCREQTDYVNRYAQMVVDAQNRYLADHQAEFDQMMAGLEQLAAEG